MSYRYEDGVKIENSEEYLEERAAEAARNAPIIAALQENEMREQRNDLLAASDWTQANDSPLANDKKIEWASYRTLLRDLPSSSDWPDVTFPTEPS